MKKGISPLIATVILVGMAVVVIGMVIVWAPGLFKEQTKIAEEKLEIFSKGSLDYKILSAEYTIPEGRDSNTFTFEFSNEADVLVHEFLISLSGDNGQSTETVSAGIVPFDVATVDVPFGDLGDINTAVIVPKTMVGETEYLLPKIEVKPKKIEDK